MTLRTKPSRACGDCQACCAVYHIDQVEPESPRWIPCHHLCASGCGLHPRWPKACAAFRCAWLDGWGEEGDRPDLLGVIVEHLSDNRLLVTEAEPAGAERARTALRALKDEGRVILVQHGAEGFAGLGRDLPDDF